MESDLKKTGSAKATQQPPLACAHHQALLHSKSKADNSFVVTKSPVNSIASLSKRSSETAATKRSSQEQLLLHPQHSRSDETVPDNAAIDVEPDVTTLSRSTTQNNKKADTDDHGTQEEDRQITKEKERQERYTKYSQKALGFAISTFTTYAISAPSNGDTVFFVATAAFFIAISADLFSWKMKPKQGGALAYISSFSLVLMTLLIFVSINKDYGYTVLALPLLIVAAFVQHKVVVPEVGKERSESTSGDKDGENLDEIFDFSALILNWGGLISATIAIIRRFVVPGPDKFKLVAVYAIGFLFFFTVLLGIYLMLVTTVRTAILTLHARYLHVLLRVVLVGTLIATLMTCIRA